MVYMVYIYMVKLFVLNNDFCNPMTEQLSILNKSLLHIYGGKAANEISDSILQKGKIHQGIADSHQKGS